ncbi:MauE/DoxX family redox-associated membrane protein [Citromicrobium bathyomarinum]|uniref:MauE/DoxX family redox-associated membrane protein n=1 Tax=Citromicrobium sp. WPS32 TaxID=1634517 RepID=UPI0006C921ED|nr:MauE/DoxX family redox-associated membrane protein [Citromicrobium sp. WPS32]KPM13710.1 membrane protein [Citromicrobium sp. WPS32]MAY77542.1 glutaredoxin [Citromicrobium sp.]|tara:strand:+ start:148 stop:885 length:738 start_codon:yes stop_codon:yes gene_type:complete
MAKTAKLYRMVMDKHVCPYGTKSKWLLEKEGYQVEDHHLVTRAETDAFKDEHGVKTTPQTFIDGERVGGYEALRKFLGKKVKNPDETSYRPVLAVFAVAAAFAITLSLGLLDGFSMRTVEWFVALSMGMLAMLKLQDVEQFSTMFVGYDLLGRRWVPYAYAYPYLEATAAVLMAAHLLPWLSIPIALFIGTVGAVSVFYAVYVQKREIKCACVGGGSNVPLGFVSLTENLAMIAMGIWMLLRALV